MYWNFYKIGLAVIAVLLNLCISPAPSFCAEFRAAFYADSLLVNNSPMEKSAAEYRSVLQEKIFNPSRISSPPGFGAYRYATGRDFLAAGEEEGEWIRLKEQPACYIDDGAFSLRTYIEAPKEMGTHRYRWTFTSPGGASVTVEWEYRILSPSYARLVAKMNGGAYRGIYGGNPVDSLDLSTGILFLKLGSRIDDEALEKYLPGTWTVNEELEGHEPHTFRFDLRMLAVRDVTVTPNPFNPVCPEPPFMTFRAKINALPSSSALFPHGWKPDSLLFRLVALKKWKDGELIVHRSFGEANSSSEGATVEHTWKGEQDDSLTPLEAGPCRILLQALGSTSQGTLKSQFKGQSLMIQAVPRIMVFNEKGRSIADSWEFDLFSRMRRDQTPMNRELPPWITFTPRGAGIFDAPEKKSVKPGDLLLSSIYLKSSNKDEKLTVNVQGLPQNMKDAHIIISSSLEGRGERSFPLPAGSGDGSSRYELNATASREARENNLFVGNLKVDEKSFAIFDITYTEDSSALRGALVTRGWRSRGEFSGPDPSNPGRVLNARDFMRAAGYETLTFTCDRMPEVKAILHIKNQASLLYYGGHGWGNGFLYLDRGYFHPLEDLYEEEWRDHLEVVILSSCSVLDIQNYNERSFTAYGKIKESPGREWEKATGPGVALLGYNWSVQEGKPPNAFDTRVIRRYISLSDTHSPPVAWLYANILEGEVISPCAIYRDYYYFTRGYRILAVPKVYWSSPGLPRDAHIIPWPK